MCSDFCWLWRKLCVENAVFFFSDWRICFWESKKRLSPDVFCFEMFWWLACVELPIVHPFTVTNKPFCCGSFGTEWYCWWLLRLVVYAIVFRLSYIPGGWEWDFSHQQYGFVHHIFVVVFVCPIFYTKRDTLPETNIAPENGWLEDKPFFLGFGPFSGANC